MATNPPPLSAQDAIDDGYLLETFLSATPDHVYFKDTESRFTRISDSFARWVGLADASEAIGLTDADFFAPAHASAARADELRVMSTGEAIVALEECESWPDGRERDLGLVDEGPAARPRRARHRHLRALARHHGEKARAGAPGGAGPRARAAGRAA